MSIPRELFGFLIDQISHKPVSFMGGSMLSCIALSAFRECPKIVTGISLSLYISFLAISKTAEIAYNSVLSTGCMFQWILLVARFIFPVN